MLTRPVQHIIAEQGQTKNPLENKLLGGALVSLVHWGFGS